MNAMINHFYKYAEIHTVGWNNDMSLFCIGTSCDGCVLNSFCRAGENIGLSPDDIGYIKEQSPEYFI